MIRTRTVQYMHRIVKRFNYYVSGPIVKSRHGVSYVGKSKVDRSPIIGISARMRVGFLV